MTPPLEVDAESIRRRMAVLRSELTGDMRQVSDSARAMTDWTYYMRKFPWVAAGLAVGAGFLLVPRKKEIVQPDPAVMAEMMKHKEAWQAASAATQPRSLVKSLAATVAAMAARAAMTYVTQRVQAAATAAVHKPESHAEAETAEPTSFSES